jgi:hypothetical protein
LMRNEVSHTYSFCFCISQYKRINSNLLPMKCFPSFMSSRLHSSEFRNLLYPYCYGHWHAVVLDFLILQHEHNISKLSVNIKFICTVFETGQVISPKARFSTCFYSLYKYFYIFQQLNIFCIYTPWPVSKTVQMNLMFTDSLLILCSCCNIKKSKTTACLDDIDIEPQMYLFDEKRSFPYL